MRPRRPAGPPPAMPAELRTFDPAGWATPGDHPGDRPWPARQRWTAARIAWCARHGVDFVDVIRGDVAAKRAGLYADRAGPPDRAGPA